MGKKKQSRSKSRMIRAKKAECKKRAGSKSKVVENKEMEQIEETQMNEAVTVVDELAAKDVVEWMEKDQFNVRKQKIEFIIMIIAPFIVLWDLVNKVRRSS